MVKGWWIEGADTSKQVVVDTLGIVYNITGEHEDGALELEQAYNDSTGYPMEAERDFQPDIVSDFEPVYDGPQASLGYGSLSF